MLLGPDDVPVHSYGADSGARFQYEAALGVLDRLVLEG